MPKFASQRFLSAILAAGLLFAAPSLQAQNKYDVLARVLQPYGALFYSKATTKAMQADVILREGPPTAYGNSQPAASGLSANAGQTPDRDS